VAPTVPLTPRNVRVFLEQGKIDEQRQIRVVVCAVCREPVSVVNFPDIREFTGNSGIFAKESGFLVEENIITSGA